LIVACAVLPLDVMKDMLLLQAAWVWPILVWSAMGSREHRFTTYRWSMQRPTPCGGRSRLPGWRESSSPRWPDQAA